ncbi:MAG: hypothetical protein ACKOU7_01305 [Ferruginibacter sp.]
MEDIKMEPVAKEQPKKRSGLRKFLWRFSLVAVLVLSFLIYWYYFNVYSDGERTGLLTKLSHKGNLFKTYEGEVLIGNFQQAPNVMVPEKFYFSVKSEKLADTLMKLQGKIISLKYYQYRKTLPWRGESVYIVTDLQRVGQ